MNTKGLLIAAGCIVVTAVLVIVLLCSFFGSSSKSVVKDYYKAIENCDAKDLMATVPKDYLAGSKAYRNNSRDHLQG